MARATDIRLTDLTTILPTYLVGIPPFMTKPPRRILPLEQIEAHQRDARAANPNAARIDSLRAQARTLHDQAAALTSDEEKYWNIMTVLSSDFDNRAAAAKCMSDNELAEHLLNLFSDHCIGDMDEHILYEVLDRLGYDDENS